MNERILLVDDDDDTRTLMCEGLRKRGLDVEMVCSAQACLRRIDAAEFAVVVTDVSMPGMSGIELCGALQARNPPLLAIVVTSLRDVSIRVSALASGAFEFLSKPINVSTLEAAIRRACAAIHTSSRAAGASVTAPSSTPAADG
jgi:DNA-binding NtrC family response regulator